MKIIISSSLLGIWILANVFFQKNLDNINESITLVLQSTLESGLTNLIMNLASKVIVIIPLLIIAASHYFTKSLSDSFYTLAQIAFCTFINTAAKILIRENRPFFERDNIKALSCECNYAMPSGHSNLISITVLCMLDTIRRLKKERDNTGSMFLITMISFSALFLVVFSRVYFGVHTISQILMGFLVALFIFDLTESWRGKFKEILRKKNSVMSQQEEDQNVSTFNVFGLMCFISVVINILITRIQSSPRNEATKRNLNKCPQCTYGLMRDTVKGILTLYCLPSVFFVASVLASLRMRQGNRVEGEGGKGAKKWLVYVLGLILTGIVAYPSRFFTKNIQAIINQISLFFIMMLLPIIAFLVPVYFLRALEIDSKEDYIDFSLNGGDNLNPKLSSMSQNFFENDKNFDEDDEGNFFILQ